MKRALFGATLVVGLLVAVGCGAGNHASLPAVNGSATPQKVAFVLKVPKSTASSSLNKRTPAYVSSRTKSVTFEVSTDGTTYGSPQLVAIDTGNSSQCPQTGDAYACTVDFNADPGTIYVRVKTYDDTNGVGNVLSEATKQQTVTEGGDNTLNFTLDGVAAVFVVTLLPTSVDAGVSGTTVTATWTALDQSGATIVAPGSIVDGSYATLEDPNLTITGDASDFGSQSYDAASKTWTVTYDGGSISDQTFTVSEDASNTGVADGTATLTVTPAATATPPPTATPVANAIVNGDFEASSTSIAPWFVCYASNPAFSPTDASPAPLPTGLATAPAAASPGPTSAPKSDDVTIAQTVPTGNTGGTAPVHGGSNAALVGRLGFTGASSLGEGKGLSGICQTVTVPSNDASLTLWIYEGSNTYAFSQNNHVGAVYIGDPFTTSAITVAGATSYKQPGNADWDKLLFAQDNCYNSLRPKTGSNDKLECDVGQTTAYGGQWLEKGPYDLSAYAGTQVTIFLGVWGSSSSTAFYNYAFYDDVVLSGS